jgi:hypothetical protein
MAEPIKYVVVCCTGQPLAYIDDSRPIGGPLTVTAAPGASQIVIGYQSREEFPTPDYGVVARTWANSNVSQTVWDDNGDYADSGHSNWTIRCCSCSKQAEMREETLKLVADEMATELEQKPREPVMSPDPAEPPLQTWEAGEDWAVPVSADSNIASTGWRPRHVIQLVALNLKLTRLNG